MSEPSTKPINIRRVLAEPGECKYCDELRETKAQFFPYHDASMSCQSGRHSHCSCDTCF
jgi:hypothetical protein